MCDRKSEESVLKFEEILHLDSEKTLTESFSQM